MTRSARDNGMHEFLCLDVDRNRLRVGPCDAFAVDGETVMRIDAGAIHGRLCSSYTSRLLEAFQDLYDRAELSIFERYGIDPRVVECDLLKGLYNRIAFDYLLTADIVHAIQAHMPEYWQVTVAGVEEVCGLRSRLLLNLLGMRQLGIAGRIRRSYRRLRFLAFGYAALPVASAATLLGVLLSLARGEQTRLEAGQTAKLYLVHADMGNRARHLQPWTGSEHVGESIVCLLGSGMRGIARGDGSAGGTMFLRPWRRSKVLASILRVARMWPLYIHYVQRMMEKFDYLPPVFPLLIHSAMCLARGKLHREWVHANLPAVVPMRIVLGWSGWADVTEFDLALQHAGHTTVHYLHGLVGDPIGYWGVSSECACKTRVDVECLNSLDIGYYDWITCVGDCAPFSADVPMGTGGRESILILTNLVHPANYRYRGIAGDRELQLLEIVAESNTTARQVTWRPHPCERDNHKEFGRLAKRAGELGFRVDSGSPLSEQLQEASFVISVFSSVLTDVVTSGKVPYVYSGVPYEDTPGWRGISTDLRFSNSRELSTLLEPGSYQELFDKHHHHLYDLFCQEQAGSA